MCVFVCLSRVAPACDLALLTVEEEEFWEGNVPALELAPLPRLYEDIMVRGWYVLTLTLISFYVHVCVSLGVSRWLVTRLVVTMSV